MATDRLIEDTARARATHPGDMKELEELVADDKNIEMRALDGAVR